MTHPQRQVVMYKVWDFTSFAETKQSTVSIPEMNSSQDEVLKSNKKRKITKEAVNDDDQLDGDTTLTDAQAAKVQKLREKVNLVVIPVASDLSVAESSDEHKHMMSFVITTSKKTIASGNALMDLLSHSATQKEGVLKSLSSDAAEMMKESEDEGCNHQCREGHEEAVVR